MLRRPFTLGFGVAVFGVFALTERRSGAMWLATLLGFLTLVAGMMLGVGVEGTGSGDFTERA